MRHMYIFFFLRSIGKKNEEKADCLEIKMKIDFATTLLVVVMIIAVVCMLKVFAGSSSCSSSGSGRSSCNCKSLFFQKKNIGVYRNDTRTNTHNWNL